MTIAVFNPWHDMALANGSPNYQPPLSAKVMAEELSHLSELWREEGKVTVWGWDPLIVHLLLKQGVPRASMPSDEQLSHIRRLSSRHTAVVALAEMSDRYKSCWCSTMAEVHKAMKAYGRVLLKSPWSCSGKGLLHIDTPQIDSEASIGWVRNILYRQGGIAVEPFYTDKKHDFAMEYEVSDGCAHYLGLSLFDTFGGTYTGNILDTEEHKLRHLGLATLQPYIQMHTDFLNRTVAPYYSGPLGIDMMLMADGTVHPCVEINLRRTMGWVALRLEQGTRLPASFMIRSGRHYEACVVSHALNASPKRAQLAAGTQQIGLDLRVGQT